jgi:hypothetical protein
MYRLATEWGAVVAVQAGSGRVVRLGVTDPQPMPVNSSLAAFVESAWRYLWLHGQESGHYDDETDDVLDAFLARLRKLELRDADVDQLDGRALLLGGDGLGGGDRHVVEYAHRNQAGLALHLHVEQVEPDVVGHDDRHRLPQLVGQEGA